MKRFKDTIKNWISRTAESPYIRVLSGVLKNSDSVLDVGSGVSSPLTKIKKTFYAEGIDLKLPKRKLKTYDKYKKGDITKLKKFYKKNSFDTAIALDVIEHLTKKHGHELLKNMENIAKKYVIVVTPNGFLKQEGTKENPYQKHISGWSINDFKKQKYAVFGLHGFKKLRGMGAEVKYKPWYFWLLVSHITQHITYFFPKYAFHIIAIKRVKK